MTSGVTPNKCYADDKNDPSFSLAWDRGSCFFWAGEINKINAAQRTIKFFKTEILKEEEVVEVKIWVKTGTNHPFFFITG